MQRLADLGELDRGGADDCSDAAARGPEDRRRDRGEEQHTGIIAAINRKGPRVGAFPLPRMLQSLASGDKSAAQGAVMVAAGLLFARSAVIVIGPQRASAQS
jgi:hypothetical protein